MKKILLVGNAITAEILYEYLKTDPRYEVVASVVDAPFLAGNLLTEIPCIESMNVRSLHPPGNFSIIMAVGYDNLNRTRETLFRTFKDFGYSIETYVHPDARVYTQHPLGEGSVVLPNAVVEPHVVLGANSLVWCNATLAHHSRVEDHCWIASGAVLSGQATVKRNTFVGVNATIVNKVVVGEYNIVGGGAFITKNTEDNAVYLARSAEKTRFSSADYIKYFGV